MRPEKFQHYLVDSTTAAPSCQIGIAKIVQCDLHPLKFNLVHVETVFRCLLSLFDQRLHLAAPVSTNPLLLVGEGPHQHVFFDIRHLEQPLFFHMIASIQIYFHLHAHTCFP